MTPIKPLSHIPIDPLIASLPKVELHLHPEGDPRLERIWARQQGRAPYDWQAHAHRLMSEIPPGIERLDQLFAPDSRLDLGHFSATASKFPEETFNRIAVDTLEDCAKDGAILAEVRYGLRSHRPLIPNFMSLFREAERQVQMRYPNFHAEAIGMIILDQGPAQFEGLERHLENCLALVEYGLAGIDFVVLPYDTEAPPKYWHFIYGLAERAAEAGLGITVHSGECSTANVAAVLQIPGLSRIGHAVYAAAEERFLIEIAERQITVECCLSCNVVVGGASSYETHPIQKFIDAGIPVTLNTDDPIRVGTTLSREYAIASALGYSPYELLDFTRNAIKASFTTSERRQKLLAHIDQSGKSQLQTTA